MGYGQHCGLTERILIHISCNLSELQLTTVAHFLCALPPVHILSAYVHVPIISKTDAVQTAEFHRDGNNQLHNLNLIGGDENGNQETDSREGAT